MVTYIDMLRRQTEDVGEEATADFGGNFPIPGQYVKNAKNVDDNSENGSTGLVIRVLLSLKTEENWIEVNWLMSGEIERILPCDFGDLEICDWG